MAYVLTADSEIKCTTKGAVAVSSSHKLKVEGTGVLTLADINGKSLSGCTVKDSNSTKQCRMVSSASGTSSKLKAGGAPVANTTLVGSTDGSTPALAPADAKQIKLKG